jgi:K+-transporting ATPase ATPase A chain
MTDGLSQIILFCAIIIALTPILGGYMARVFTGQRNLLTPLIEPVEQRLYAAAGITAAHEQHWTRYALSVLLVNFLGFVLLYGILRLQHILPLNPQGFGPLSPDLAFNTSASFVTNTNWQAYSGETTMSYFSQMAGLTVQNFLSAATGLAVAIAVIRGFTGRQIRTLGSFYVDLTRSILYVLLPASLIFALILIALGLPQTLAPYTVATTLEGGQQVIAHGPVASQVAIKQLGTNGGGFFGANAAHPFENPTPITNFLQMVMMMAIPAALTYTFGRMVGFQQQGWAIFGAIAILFALGLGIAVWAETSPNPLLAGLPLDQSAGNMEGKEVRFGAAASALWAVITTALSCGAVNAMHDSFMPLGGMVAILNIQFGEIIFGGIGAGLYGMLFFVLLAVFVAGLMVGRTPEYLGKKIEAKEVKLTVLAMLSLSVLILTGTAIAAVIPQAAESIRNPGPHGLTQLLYAYSSATGNNGSAFAGFAANTPFHNTLLGICMIIGRFAFIIPILCIAASLGAKRTVPPSSGTFPTHTPLFVGLLIFVIIILEAITYFPVLALGPIAEHMSMRDGRSF